MQSYKYTIITKKFITDQDKKTLINLYQPILGSKACSIYLTLIEEKEIVSKLKNIKFENSRLCSILKTSPEKLEAHIKKLEGMQLIKRTYNKTTDLMKFIILNPLEPNEFFNNVIFNETLKRLLDEDNYEVLKYYYKDFTSDEYSDEYEDVSCSFEEAFPSETSKLKVLNINNVDEISMNFEPTNIDFFTIENGLIENDIPLTAFSGEIKKIILDNINFYNLNSNLILELLFESYDDNELLFNVKKFSDLLNKELVSKNSIKQENSSKRDMIELQPLEYLESLIERKPTIEEKIVAKTLMKKFKLNNSIINCLFSYSFFKNEKRIIGEYLYKIAKSLNKKFINNLDDTMEYLKNAYAFSSRKDNEELIVEEDLTYTINDEHEINEDHNIGDETFEIDLNDFQFKYDF